MTVKLVKTITPQPIPAGAEPFTVTTRDGVRLATDVYLPSNPGRHPTVLVRTPYDKTSRYTGLWAQARFYNERGYVFVAQDVRGKFRSEGQTLPYHFDVQDAFDTIDWIASQSWSDGTVGLTGASYYGYTVWAGVATGHPAVRAAIPRVTGADKAADHLGALWSQRVPRLTGFNDLVQIWTNNNDYLIEVDYTSAHVLDLLKSMEEIVGKSDAVSELLSRAATQDYFNPYGPRHPYHTTNVPILHWVNWYDPGLAPFGMADWRYFRANPNRRDLHYLRAGSADHGEFMLRDVGRGDAGNPYLDDETQHKVLTALCGEAIDFFDQFVRGRARSRPRPRARWHLGHDDWHHSDEWVPSGVRAERFYLTAGGARKTSGRLTRAPDRAATDLNWVHDPDKPVPSSATIEEIWYFLAAYPDERHLASREDVVTFTSEPVPESLDIAGRPILRAVVTSTGPSMHLFATVQDVMPDGTTRPISHGHLVTNATKGEPLWLPLDDIAYRFRPGNRVQLQIRSSNFPWYLVHPGTDENPWFATRRVPTTQTLRTGGIDAATLDMPVLDKHLTQQA
jgi:putative CocE/NonD family hydrolase